MDVAGNSHRPATLLACSEPELVPTEASGLARSPTVSGCSSTQSPRRSRSSLLYCACTSGVAENILDPPRQGAFMHVHCLSPAQQRHVTNAAAAMLPPAEVPLPLARVAEIMLTMGSQMLRSPRPSYVVTFANSATRRSRHLGSQRPLHRQPCLRLFFLRKSQWLCRIKLSHTSTASVHPSWSTCLSIPSPSAHGTTLIS
jgi:hypothetical protein